MGDKLAEGAAEVRWAPRVPPHKIRRLYETDALGIVDDEQIDDVGFALYARCQSILRVSAAHKGTVTCPRCGAAVVRPKPVQVRRQVLRCASCDWGATWGAYFDTYRGKQLKGGSAVGAFREFVERFPAAGTPRARMMAIDRLLHAFHHELSASGPTRPAGINLIEGSLSDVIDFLQNLTHGHNERLKADAEQEHREAALARARLGNRLRLLRHAARLSGTQLGVRAGLRQSKISEIETGRVAASVEAIERFARGLGATAEVTASLLAEARASGPTDPPRPPRSVSV